MAADFKSERGQSLPCHGFWQILQWRMGKLMGHFQIPLVTWLCPFLFQYAIAALGQKLVSTFFIPLPVPLGTVEYYNSVDKK
jgi:hypothetical protein